MIEDTKTEAAERIAEAEKQAKTETSIITEETKVKIDGAMQMVKELGEKLKKVEKERDILDEKNRNATQVSLRLTDSG
jgi:hypothetical protein